MRWLTEHSWWLLLAVAVVSFVFGLGDLVAGAPDNALAVTARTNEQLVAQSPAAYRLVEVGIRSGGLHLMFIGAVSAAMLVFGFRRNLRWAWWAMWSLPLMTAALVVVHLSSVAPGQNPAPPVYSGTFLTVLSVATLLASAPRFFARPGSN